METRDCSQFTSDLININVQDELNKGTLLHYACKFGEIEAVKYLIKNGANRFIEDSNGETPIFYILKFCDNVDLIRTVLGVDESFPHISELLLHKNFENFDVMQIAIQNGRRNIANYLLQKFPEFYGIVLSL
uniref:Ankyrin repeat protein n=1 Tax=Panagrolaimus superbus TaxID=310955 RepID=A0A914XPS7_9BILA